MEPIIWALITRFSCEGDLEYCNEYPGRFFRTAVVQATPGLISDESIR
jgi:hypothetical protein